MGLKDDLLIKKLKQIKKQYEQAIISKGIRGTTSLIRSKKLIGMIHEYIKEELVAQGVNRNIIHPPLELTSPEMCLSGFLKTKDQDIMVIPSALNPETVTDGVLIGETDQIGKNVGNKSISINIRSQLSSIGKNFDTLYERTFAEALNLHLRLPDLICGEVYLIPLMAYDDKLIEQKIIGFREKLSIGYIKAFQAINKRGSHEKGEAYKYERVCLLIVNFRKNPPMIINDVKDLIDEGMISQDDTKNITLEGLKIGDFILDILKTYKERHGSIDDLKYDPEPIDNLEDFV